MTTITINDVYYTLNSYFARQPLSQYFYNLKLKDTFNNSVLFEMSNYDGVTPVVFEEWFTPNFLELAKTVSLNKNKTMSLEFQVKRLDQWFNDAQAAEFLSNAMDLRQQVFDTNSNSDIVATLVQWRKEAIEQLGIQQQS